GLLACCGLRIIGGEGIAGGLSPSGGDCKRPPQSVGDEIFCAKFFCEAEGLGLDEVLASSVEIDHFPMVALKEVFAKRSSSGVSSMSASAPSSASSSSSSSVSIGGEGG
uniref:Uncharacterized protein n=1 Tax=Glossina palpalis gambiensis TaxID=67801 RepID=A0A1B0AP90_9MUSC